MPCEPRFLRFDWLVDGPTRSWIRQARPLSSDLAEGKWCRYVTSTFAPNCVGTPLIDRISRLGWIGLERVEKQRDAPRTSALCRFLVTGETSQPQAVAEEIVSKCSIHEVMDRRRKRVKPA